MSPRTVGDLSHEQFTTILAETGFGIQIGPFAARLQVSAQALEAPMYQLYKDYPLLADDTVYSFHARLADMRKLPRLQQWVRFSVDGRVPHDDMPAYQALAVLEWGINLVIALRSHCYLMLHSAVLERNGFAIVLPGEPGDGKSTLCAAMAHRGWRLLSDEFGLVRPGTNELIPIPRPIALKEASIDVIRSYLPEAHIGPSIPNTRKGTVAHVRPQAESVQQQMRRAAPRWVVFPRWTEGAPLELEPISKAEGFLALATNAFNYELLGEDGFLTVRSIIQNSDCYRLTYSDLDDVIECLNDLADRDKRD